MPVTILSPGNIFLVIAGLRGSWVALELFVTLGCRLLKVLWGWCGLRLR